MQILRVAAVLAGAGLLVLTAGESKKSASDQAWPAVGGGPERTNYSPLDQITTANVARLQLAWKHDTGDAFKDSEMQANPIVVDGVLYTTTPRLRVIALDAATGKLRWSFDPAPPGKPLGGKRRNRGVNYWAEGTDRRIFSAAGPYLHAIDARTGRLIPTFGKKGRVDLREGLGRDPATLNVSANSPGAVYKDLLILGSIVSEGLPAAPGHIRAFDVRTGKIRWSFRTIPQPGEYGYDTWPKDAWQYTGGANSWAGLTLDEKRGIVYAPTGSAAFDFYGANRHGDNLFANCLLALKAETGERVWHFQFIRHDVWDRDLPTAPSLVQVRRDGRVIEAVAQITKSGHVFVFDRDSGTSLFPLEEREAPPSDVEGELLARKQVLPLKPEPFARQRLTEDLLSRRTPQVHKEVLERFRKLRSGEQFTPPSREGTIIFPGFDGGGEWGGASFDPDTGILYVNSNEMAWVLRLVPIPKVKAVTGRSLYISQCAGCHRADLAGTPPEFPSLQNLSAHRTRAQVDTVIRKGAGRMPGFGHLQPAALNAINRYVWSRENVSVAGSQPTSPIDLPYGIDGYNKFLDTEGYPAVAPPWGTLNAIDLHTGEYVWKIPFGEFPDLAAKGMTNTGSENYGGGIVTKGGVLFIGATNHDRKFRAYDKANGKLLWETTLDSGGNATPAVYQVNGKQYVVIGAGGGKSGQPSGGAYYAFALP